MTLNETVTVKYKIANEETDVGANVTVDNVTNSNPTYYDVSATLNSSNIMCPSTSDVGDYKYLIVTVKLKKTPIDEASGKTNIGVTITSTAAEDPNCPE